MVNEQILKYLQENTTYPRETLIVQLRTSGFSEADIQAAIVVVDGGVPPLSRSNGGSVGGGAFLNERIKRVEAQLAKRFKNHDILVKTFVVFGFLMLVTLLVLDINNTAQSETISIFVASIALFLYAVLGHQITRGLSGGTQTNIRITLWMSVALLFSGASGLLFLFVLVDSIRTNSQLKKALEVEGLIREDLPKKKTHIEMWHWIILAPGIVSLVLALF